MNGFVAGYIVTFVIGMIAAKVVFDHQVAKTEYWKAKCFALTEKVLHLKQKIKSDPFDWELRTDGIDIVVEKRRPDAPRRTPTVPSGEVLLMVDIDDLPKWGDDD